MKSRFILEIDNLASIEANLEFLDKCEKQIKQKRKDLKEMQAKSKIKTNQLDLEEENLK